ncbi:unnamed protein product [Urochloa decumbens]|uniref:Uncharacterized protein n=1 Tax=Urochloa decumbens TaxID=240449 RepID=A0ABC8WVL3_9POAL
MAGQSPLRRWKLFFAAFGLVDAAIEAADPALRRDEIRSSRGEVVELLCGVPAGDAGKAEELCVALDGFMAESLLTLLAVPAEAVPSVLKSSADLPKAVGALRMHHQAKERFDAVHGVNKAAPKLDAKRGSAEVEEKKMEAPEASRRSSPDVKKRESAEEKERMEATKRKLREGYREAEDAKRQRKIQVIAAPKMVEQARCGTSAAVVRRSLVSSFNRV